MRPEVHHVHIYVEDAAATVAMLQQAFGAEFVSVNRVGDQEIHQVRLGGTSISFSGISSERRPGVNHLAVSVPDIDVYAARLIEQGWTPEADARDIPGNRIQFLNSPEGVRFELMQPMP